MSSAKTILGAGSLSNDTPRLVGRFGDESGEVALEAMTTFGRAPENTVQVKDREISKQHCSIQRVEGSFLLRDVGSSNGTFVNGHKVRELRLRDGDELAFGDSRVIFHSGRAVRGGALVFDGGHGHAMLNRPAAEGRPSERSMLADLLIRGFVKEKNPSALLAKASQAALQLTGSDWVALLLRQRAGNFVVRAEARRGAAGPAPEHLVQLAAWVVGGDGLVAWDDLDQRPDQFQHPGYRKPLGSETRLSARAVLAAPLIRAEATLAVLIAGCVERTAAFDQECGLHFLRLGTELVARLPPVAELEFWG